MEEKKILVTRSSMPEIEEYIAEIEDLWESHWLTNMGEKHKTLQKELCRYLSVKHIDLLTNGHMALELTLQAMELHGEVITTPFTFSSTTHAIVRNGLTPVFCDIKRDDYTIDVNQIEDRITERTCAIVPVHVYGNICDVHKIEQIAHKHNLKVIYDAAHAFGVRYNGVGIGNYGDASCFSFHATKVFHTIEGGAVCYNNEEFGRKIYNLKNFGIRGPEEVESVGANAKMDEFRAAMGICNLRHIDEQIRKRATLVQHYRERLTNLPGIQLNLTQAGVTSNYGYFPVLFNKENFGYSRDEIFDRLEEQGIYTRKYFYPIISEYDCYKDNFDPHETPVAMDVSRRVLTLPLYADLSIEEVDKICDIILKR